MTEQPPQVNQRWVECENVGSQAIPSWGVVEITGVVNTDGQRMVLQVRRPTADNRTTVAVNFISPIAVGGFGKCTLSMPTFAVYDTSNSPVNGEEWGTQANLFTLKKDNTGFLIHGGLLGSGATSRVEVQRAFGAASDDAKIGKVNDASGIPAISGDTMTGATVDIYTATGGSLVITAPLETITAYNASDTAIDDGDVVLCHNESETNIWITTATGSSADDSKIGKTNTIVAAKSGSTMGGSADNVDIYTMTGGVVAITSGPLETLTGYNPNEEAIPSGTFVLCTRETASSEWVLEYLEAGFTYAAAGIGGTGSERVQPTDTLTVLGDSTDLGFDVHEVARVSTVVFDTVHMAFTTCTGLVTADFTASDTTLTDDGVNSVDAVTTMQGKAVATVLAAGTVKNSIGASGSNNDRVFLSYDHTASLAAAADRWEITTPPGGSWNANADSGGVQVISHGDELLIKGGTGVSTATSFGAVATVTVTITDPIFSVASSPASFDVNHGGTVTFTDSTSIDFSVSAGPVVTASIVDPMFTITPTSGTAPTVSHSDNVTFTAGAGMTITGDVATNIITFASSGGGADWSVRADSGSDSLIDATRTVVDFDGGSAKTASATDLIKTTVSSTAGVATLKIEGDISIATKRIYTEKNGSNYQGEVSGDTTVGVEDGTDNAEEWEASWGVKFETTAFSGKTQISARQIWAVATTSVNENDSPNSFSIKLANSNTGSNQTTTVFTCYVHGGGGIGKGGVNIQVGDVIAVSAVATATADNLFVTNAGADDPIGTVKQWVGNPASLRGGWKIMDGSANSTPGSAVDMRSQFVRCPSAFSGSISSGGTSAGSDTHGHPAHPVHYHSAPLAATVHTTGTGAFAGTTDPVCSSAPFSDAACTINETQTHVDGDNVPAYTELYFIERVD